MKIPIFVINLKKNVKRKQMMIEQFVRFNIQNYIFFDAVDGINYDKTKYNVQIMQNWCDPDCKRYINHGEIGCFISHYQIWEKIVADKLNAAIILEDDNLFNADFMLQLQNILTLSFNTYDLFYLSRVKNNPNIIEQNLTNNILIPSYSYLTNAYILTFNGANKLIAAPCIQNLIPVDEFLSIMYDNNYPYKQYSNVFATCEKLIPRACINDITRQMPRHLFPSDIVDSDVYNPNQYMEQTLRIFDNFLDDALYKECYEYSISKLSSTELSFRTNHFWEPGVVKDSNLVLIHILSPDTILHQKICHTLQCKCEINTLKIIQFYYWTQGSHIPWHNDGNDNGGLTIYLNSYWDENWGGIFLYKDGETINGFYPKPNRSIMQIGGVPHSVVPTSKNSDVRLTIQIVF